MSTVNQLILSFKQKLDKIDSSAYPDILEQEIRYWLDQAADRFVKQRYEQNNFKRKSFEQSQKRINDLRNVIETTTLATVPTTDYRNATQITFPNDYRYTVKLEVNVQYEDCNDNEATEWVTPKHISHDDLYAVCNDPFNKPSKNRPTYIIEDSRIILFAGEDATVTSVRLTYIKLLRKLQNNLINADGTINVYQTLTTNYTELAVDTHEEFVDIAVKMVLENVESQRYQTNSVEITQQE